MLWSKTIVQQQKLVTLRLTGKPSFYIKHDCCSMMDSKLMYYHYFYSPFINTVSHRIAFKRRAIESPATKKRIQTSPGSKNSLPRPAFSTYS